MPFVSKAMRRKFYALKQKGEMDQKTIDEWEKETPTNIPERKKTAMINRFFWNGFQKRAAETYVSTNSGMAAPGAPEKMLKLNDLGGIDPRTPEELQVAQAVGLRTLPQEVEGASCGTCAYFQNVDENGHGTCSNPEIGLDVTQHMFCAHWEHPGSMSPEDQMDAQPLPMQPAQQMQPAQPTQPTPPAGAQPAQQMQSMQPAQPEQVAPEAGAGSTPNFQSSAVGTQSGFPEGAKNSSNPLTEQITSDFQGQDASAAPTTQGEPAPKKDKPKKEKKDGKNHTININVGGEKTASVNPWADIVEGY